MAELEAGKANPNPEPVKPAAKPAVDATKYVGTPAVGTSKAAAAAGVAGTAPSTEIDRHRRRFVWTMVTGFLVAWNLWIYAMVLTSEIGLQAATNIAYAWGPGAAWIPENKWFIGVASCVIIGGLAALSTVGLGAGKWLHGAGGLTMVLVLSAMILLPLPAGMTYSYK